MKRLIYVGALVALVILLGYGAFRMFSPGPSGIPFKVSSLGGKSAIQGTFEGTYLVQANNLILDFKKSSVYVSGMRKYKGRSLIGKVYVGLGQEAGDGKWMVTKFTEIGSPDEILNPGESFSFQPQSVRIYLDQARDLSNYWLVFRIRSMPMDVAPERMRYGSSHAYSPRDIFKGR